MAYCHRNSDARICGAKTTVVGQDFLKINGELWAVDGDPNDHGDGALGTSHSWLKIAGKGIIVRGDGAAPDTMCVPPNPHCNPYADGYDNLINIL